MSDIRKAFAAIASKAFKREIELDGQKHVVYFRHMGIGDFLAARGLVGKDQEAQFALIPELIARFLCDEKGVVIYDYKSKEHLAEIEALDVISINAIATALFDAISEMNNVKSDDKEKGEAPSPN
jgi:hypothetical protein